MTYFVPILACFHHFLIACIKVWKEHFFRPLMHLWTNHQSFYGSRTNWTNKKSILYWAMVLILKLRFSNFINWLYQRLTFPWGSQLELYSKIKRCNYHDRPPLVCFYQIGRVEIKWIPQTYKENNNFEWFVNVSQFVSSSPRCLRYIRRWKISLGTQYMFRK